MLATDCSATAKPSTAIGIAGEIRVSILICGTMLHARAVTASPTRTMAPALTHTHSDAGAATRVMFNVATTKSMSKTADPTRREPPLSVRCRTTATAQAVHPVAAPSTAPATSAVLVRPAADATAAPDNSPARTLAGERREGPTDQHRSTVKRCRQYPGGPTRRSRNRTEQPGHHLVADAPATNSAAADGQVSVAESGRSDVKPFLRPTVGPVPNQMIASTTVYRLPPPERRRSRRAESRK